MEKHLIHGSTLSAWLGISYEPVRLENGEILLFLRRNPSDKLKKIMTAGIYDEHAFLIKDIQKLGNLYGCIDSLLAAGFFL